MRISSWLKNWRRRKQGNRTRVAAQAVERFEERSLLSASVLVIGGSELNITLELDDSVSVSSANGAVVVQIGTSGGNQTPVAVGGLQASAVQSIVITGGEEGNSIDLSGVLAADFTNLTNISVNGGNGDDSILGSNDFADSLFGDDGEDTLDGQGGDDTLDGEDGADVIRGGNGTDSINGGDGADNVDAGADNDTVNAGNGADSVTLGDGNDFANGANGEDTMSGGLGDDTINGDGGLDFVNGDEGNDSILGGEKNDTLNGGDGDDTLDGQSGNDNLNGEAGNDSISGSSGQDLLTGSTGDDTLNGNGGNDTVQGDDGNDSLIGGSGNDSMRGGFGLDTLNGQAGDDILEGEFDTDLMIGGAGNDLLDSTAGIGPPAAPPSLSVSDAAVPEGNSGTTIASFTVTLSQTVATTVTVDYTTTAGSAAAGTDFVAQSGVLTFAPGVTTQTVTIPINGDVAPENNEFFFLDLSNPTNAVLVSPQGIGQITNDEGTTGTLQLLDANFSGTIFRLDQGTAASTMIGTSGFSLVHGITADLNTGTVYGLTQNGEIFTINPTTGIGTFRANVSTLPPGEFEGDIAFDASSNLLYWLASDSFDAPNLVRIDPNTGASVVLGDLQVGGTPLSGAGANADACAFRGNTLYAVITGGLTGSNANLNDSLITIDLTTLAVTLVGPLGIDFAIGGAGLAYDPSSDLFYFVSSTFTTDDLYQVNPTTGAATLVGSTGISGFSTGLTFAGTASPAVVTIDNPSLTESDSGTTNLSFTVTLSRPTVTAVTVQFATEPSTALSGADYLDASGTITFLPGQTTQTVNVPVVGDLQLEGTEVFFVRLSSPTGADLGDALGVGTILDNDSDRSADSLFGGNDNDTLIGGAGDELINAGSGDDLVLAGDGNDSVVGGSGSDTLFGEGGNDTLNGQGGNDVIEGGGGDDTIIWDGAVGGNDTLTDATGDNTLIVNGSGVANNFVVGKNASDQLVVSESGKSVTVGPNFNRVVVNGNNGDDTITVGDLQDVSAVQVEIFGGNGNDLITAVGALIGNVRLSLNGDAGNDTVIGSEDADTITGGIGNDTLQGGGGNDTIIAGDGNDNVFGQAGDDSLQGNAGDDSLRGNDGNDIADGADGADVLLGQAGNDSLLGGAGDDSLDGSTGGDTLLGDLGIDTLSGGDDNDSLDGGRNDDSISGGTGDDMLRGDHGNDSIDAGDGDDTVIAGDGNDTVIGGLGNDAMNGSDGDDIVNGGAGNDTILGGDGADTIAGGSGGDVLLGGDGDDSINGQGGTDTIAGNQGIDTIVDPVNEIDETFTLSNELLTVLEAV